MDQFIAECPGCGTIIGRWRGNDNKAAFAKCYDPKTGRWTCPVCKRTWGVGLVIWSLSRGTPRRMPLDTVPNPRQAQAMRNLVGAIWPYEERPQEETNLFITQECTCPCPVHDYHPQITIKSMLDKEVAYDTMDEYEQIGQEDSEEESSE